MKVISISLDPKILDRDTPAALRTKAYGEMVESYIVLVPTPAAMTTQISDNTVIYGIGGRNKLTKLWRFYKKLNELARAGQCNVITSSDMYYLGLVSLMVARRHHLGLEVSVLGIEKLNGIRKRIAQYVLRHASTVRALSSRIRGRLINEFGVQADRITVISIHVPIDTLGFNPGTLTSTEADTLERLRTDFRTHYGEYINFLSVSRLVPIKRIELQLQALAELIKERQDIRLHIVGDGPLADTLMTEASNLGVAEHVIFHGRKTGFELGLFYLECDCFLLTSDYEGFGMVVVEAATAGLPVIMTDVGTAGEFLVDGENGLVVPVGDATAIAAAMRRICTDKALRQSLSYGTKKHLERLESFEVILDKYKANWEVALAQRL